MSSDQPPSGSAADQPPSSAYGEAMVTVYDWIYPPSPDAQLTADFVLGQRPEPKRVLELAVGTGRLAIPIGLRGAEVVGVDASPKMLEQLARHDKNGCVRTVLGNMVDVELHEEFDVVLLALNTLFVLPDQEDQIRTLATMRRHTAPEGRVVVEAYDPSPYHRMEGPTTVTYQLGADGLMIDAVSTDPSQQTVVIVHSVLQGATIKKSIEISRYAWPSELDLMARLAGLELVERYGDWSRAPYTAQSSRHVSVYRPSTS